MNISRYLKRWSANGLISVDQAEKLLADVKQVRKSETQSNFIIALSTIGAVLFGVGAILFISSNWQSMGDLFKVFLLLFVTASVLFVGYYFKYEKQVYTRFGGALIFLSTLLVGATVFLTAQIYNVEANDSWLLLFWGMLMLPVVYLEKSTPLALLFMGVSYLWFWYFFDESSLSSTEEFSVFLFLLFALFWFEIGTLHKLKNQFLAKIARIYRIVSIQIALIILFVLSFKDFLHVPSYGNSIYGYSGSAMYAFATFKSLFLIGTVILILFMILSYLLKLINNKDEMAERFFGLAAVLSVFAYFNLMGYSLFFVLLFNFILAGVAICLIYFGYKREDPKLLNMGSLWLGLLILARYFDLFFDMLPTSLFFLFGGIILLGGGFVLERSRRELLSHIKGEENV